MDSPAYAPGTPLDSPVWAPSGTPLDSSDFISNNNSLQSPDYAIEYNIGDKVHFRSDFKQNRIWSVKNVSNKFITLETDDFVGLNENDYIKVVTTNDIYKVKELPYSDINDTPISGLKQMNVDTIDKPQPNIFAPVINIGRPIQNAEEPNINDTISSKIPSDLIKGEIQIQEPTIEEESLNTTDLSKIGKGENVIIKKV